MHLNRVPVRLLFLLLLLFNSPRVFSQLKTQALLNNWLKAKSQKSYRSDTANVTLLNQIADAYMYSQADSSRLFAEQALQLAQWQNNSLGQAISLNNIGMAHYVMGHYYRSLSAANKLIDISNTINYKAGIASAHQLIGLIFLAQDKCDDAIAEFLKAINLFSELNNKARLARLYFDVGLSYDERAGYKKAVYKLDDSTFYYLNKAIALSRQIGDRHVVAMAQNRTGETWFHLKNYSKAIYFYQTVLNSGYQDNWERGFAFSGMAKAYYALGKYKQAINNALQSLNYAKELDTRYDKVRALRILSDSYAAIKDYNNAYNYNALFKVYSDSLLNDNKEKEINYLHLKQQQSDNIRLEKELAMNKQKVALTRLLVVITGLFALFAIGVVIIISRINLHKTALNKELEARNLAIAQQKEELSSQKEALDQLNRTKNQLFSVISHDLRSPFAAILQSMDLMRSDSITPQEKGMIQESFYQQVTLVTIMVNNLLVWANSQQQGIKAHMMALNIGEAVEQTIGISNFLAHNKNIRIYHRANNEPKTAFADLDHVKIILQNLVGNAIKFTPAGGVIDIFYTEDDTYLAIHIKDNGIGIPPEKMDKLFKVIGKEISGYGTNNEAGAGIGLALIKQFIEVNQGKIEVYSNNGAGTEFIVYLRKGAI